jgi:hypothetical protein
MKGNGQKGVVRRLQPLNGTFPADSASWRLRWIWSQENSSGVQPRAFHGVLELPTGVLGPRDGTVIVDLVEPYFRPISWPNVIREVARKDVVPCVVIGVAA